MVANASSRIRVLLRRSFKGVIALALLLSVVGVWLWFNPHTLYRVITIAGHWNAGLSERSVDIQGHRWRVLDSDPDTTAPESMRTVLALHGLGTSAEAMLSIASMVPENARVLIPDLPGFGEHATHGTVVHNAAFYLEAIHDFQVHEKLGRVDVVGTSMGGALAVAYAVRYPTLVRSLVLLSPAGVTAPKQNDFMRRVVAGEIPLDIKDESSLREVLRLNFVHQPPMPPPIRAAFIERAIERREAYLRIVEDMRPLLTTGLEQLLPSLSTPTLVLYGANDQLTDPSMIEVFRRDVPNIQSAIISDAGHVLSYDAPAKVADAMRAFYRSIN